jgi:hypothetical protein
MLMGDWNALSTNGESARAPGLMKHLFRLYLAVIALLQRYGVEHNVRRV